MQTLPRDFCDRDTEDVARDLLGKLLVRREGGIERVGRVVESHAYLGPHDLAAHSARGRTARTEAIFGLHLHAHVYLICGMYHCFNAVTGGEGEASAVLLRALEPVRGIELSTSGPGRLCRALDIDRKLYGHDLTEPGPLFFAEPEEAPEPFEIVSRPRVGVDYAGEWAEKPLRFYIAGNPC